MDVKVAQARDLSTDELERLKGLLNEARSNRLTNRIQIATSNMRTKAWMAANNFVTIVNNITGQSAVEFFGKGTKIAGAIAVTTAAASLVSPIAAPALSTVAGIAGATTIGGVIAQAATKALHKFTESAKTKIGGKIEAAEQDHTAAEGKKEGFDEAYTAAKSAYDGENERLAREREAQRREDWENLKKTVRDGATRAWQATKSEFEEIKGTVKGKIGEIKGWADGKKQAREAAKKARAEELQRQLEARKAEEEKAKEAARKEAEEQARKDAAAAKEAARIAAEEKAKKLAAKKAKADKRSHRLLNFLTKSVAFVGKDFIAEHLLTEEDRQSYDGVKQAVNEQNELKVNKINEILGTTYSAKDLARMSDRQLARIDKQVRAVEAKMERDATNAL